MTTKPLLISILTVIFSTIAHTQGQTLPPSPYLKVVKNYADALIEHGTDRWGPEKTNMIVSIMDREKLAPGTRNFKYPSGIRKDDRVTPYGSNVNLDQNMYRVLYALSYMSRDPKYRDAANAALRDFLKKTPHPVTGFFAWGEHLCWDLEQDGPGFRTSYPIHEPKRETVLFNQFYQLDPERTIQYCETLWEFQIQNHENGNFSRHGRYDQKKPRYNEDFPKEGGYFIHDWARAYQKTKDKKFLEYIDVLASRFIRKMEKNSYGLLEFDSTRNWCNTSAGLSLAVDCAEAAKYVDDASTRKILNKTTDLVDTWFLKLDHDVKGKGFVEFMNIETYERYSHKDHDGYSWDWSMKYGRKTTAMDAILCLNRFQQLPAGAKKKAYKKLFLEAADKYLTSRPDLSEDPWPVEVGMVISLEIAAYKVTGDRKYLATAEELADWGIKIYWPDDSPLPLCDPSGSHYENVTRADTLVYALLDLYTTQHPQLRVALPTSNIDR